MGDKIELDGKVYHRSDGRWYDASNIGASGEVQRELNRLYYEPRVASAPTATAKPATQTSSSEDSSFHHDEVFPIIAQVIRQSSRPDGAYMTHHEIVTAFLNHVEGRRLAEEAAQKQGKDVQSITGNMVAFFSKSYTENDSPYQSEFERDKLSGGWAYRTRG